MSIKKLWDHIINTKEEFVPRKRKRRYMSLYLNNWEKDILDPQNHSK